MSDEVIVQCDQAVLSGVLHLEEVVQNGNFGAVLVGERLQVINDCGAEDRLAAPRKSVEAEDATAVFPVPILIGTEEPVTSSGKACLRRGFVRPLVRDV